MYSVHKYQTTKSHVLPVLDSEVKICSWGGAFVCVGGGGGGNGGVKDNSQFTTMYTEYKKIYRIPLQGNYSVVS